MFNLLLAFVIFVSSFLHIFPSRPTLTPSPTPQISKWQTYTNSKYLYSFRFPSNWNLYSEADFTQTAITNFDPDVPRESIYYPGGIKIGITSNSPEFITHPAAGKKEVFAGHQSLKTSLSLSGFTTYSYYIDIQNIRYVIDVNLGEGASQKTADSILSTFKFLEKPSLETSAWKIYTHSNPDFSLSYPPDYTIKTSNGQQKTVDIGEFISVWVWSYPQSLNNFIDNFLCDSPGVCASSKKAVDTTVAKQPAKKVINRPYPISTELTLVKTGPNIIGLELVTVVPSASALSLEQRKAIFGRLLSSFKFLDRKGMDTSNWKTYINTLHGFSIKYPEGMKIDETSNGDGSVKITLLGSTQKPGTSLYDGIGLYFNSGTLGGKTLKEVTNDQSKESDTLLIPPQPASIAGLNGYTFRSRGLGETTYYYLPGKSGVYIVIGNYSNDPTGQGYQNTVDQILSTFHFSN